MAELFSVNLYFLKKLLFLMALAAILAAKSELFDPDCVFSGAIRYNMPSFNSHPTLR